MSRIHHSAIDLPGVIRHSTHVAIAIPLSPASSRVDVPDEAGIAPSFSFSRSHFMVKQVLMGPSSSLIDEHQELDIDDAYASMMEELHWSIHRSGTRKSAVLLSYRGSSSPSESDPRIVFIRASVSG